MSKSPAAIHWSLPLLPADRSFLPSWLPLTRSWCCRGQPPGIEFLITEIETSLYLTLVWSLLPRHMHSVCHCYSLGRRVYKTSSLRRPTMEWAPISTSHTWMDNLTVGYGLFPTLYPDWPDHRLGMVVPENNPRWTTSRRWSSSGWRESRSDREKCTWSVPPVLRQHTRGRPDIWPRCRRSTHSRIRHRRSWCLEDWREWESLPRALLGRRPPGQGEDPQCGRGPLPGRSQVWPGEM